MSGGPAPDVLIVGGGSAGCVLAHRLSAGGRRVLLLEAGADTPPGAVPADIRDIYPRSYSNGAYFWPGLTAQLGEMGRRPRRERPFPQARVIGGGSSVMGMIALRGVPEDYDAWPPGWRWDDLLPAFRRLEDDWDYGEDPRHGRGGPTAIRRHRPAARPPVTRAVAAAVGRRGLPLVEDMNTEFGDGHGRLPLSATLAGRVSAASAYLDAATRARPNLEIATGTFVERLLFEGTRCTGVGAVRDGERRRILAGHTILAAGAIHSPAILLRSGVGPPATLERLGIAPVLGLAGVGAGLQNHPVVYLAAHLRRHGRQPPWLRPHFITALRFGSEPSLRADTIMLVMNKSSWHGLGEAVAGLGVGLYLPFSRGSVTLRAADPATPPAVRFAMLSEPRDRERMVAGLGLALDLMEDGEVRGLRHELFATGYSATVRRLNEPGLRNVLATQALARILDGPERLRRNLIRWGIAGGEREPAPRTRSAWLERTVRRHAFGMYHPSSTCRMGDPGDPEAVVDAACRVIGADGLSVVDASVMPRLVRANTNVPVLAIAERAAELL